MARTKKTLNKQALILCSKCLQVAPRHKKNSGICHECIKKWHNQYQKENKDKIHVYQGRLREKPLTRATALLAGARNRAKKAGIKFTLTKQWIYDCILAGCAVTGLKFDLGKHSNGIRHGPFSPSLDRIQNNGDYTPENTRMVVWIFNLARHLWTDDDVFKMAKALVDFGAIATGDATETASVVQPKADQCSLAEPQNQHTD